MPKTNLKFKLIFPVIIFFAFFALAGEARAATRVISANALESETRCTAAYPCTWAVAYAASAANDVIQVRSTGGSFKNQQWNITKSITVEAYGTEAPVIDGQDAYPIPTASVNTRYSNLLVINAPNVELEGITVSRSTGGGLKILEKGDNAIISNCSFNDSWESGVSASSNFESDYVTSITVDNCRVFRNVKRRMFANDAGARPAVPGDFKIRDADDADDENLLKNDVAMMRYDGAIIKSVSVAKGSYTGISFAASLKSSIDKAFSISSTVSWNPINRKLTIVVGSGHTIQYVNLGSSMGKTIGFTSDSSTAQSITSQDDCGWDWGTVWGAALVYVRTDGGVIKNTKVYQNYHEGLGLYKHAINCLVENTEVFGNHRLQLYISNSHKNTVRNSVFYGAESWYTRTNGYVESGYGFGAVILSGEQQTGFTDSDYENRFYGNYVAASNANLILGGQDKCADDIDGKVCGEKNSRVFNNVFVEADDRYDAPPYAMKVHSGSRSGNIVKNNAFLQAGGSTDATVAGKVDFSSNLWNRQPTANARGTGDNYAAFSLQRTAWANIPSEALLKTDFNFKSATTLYQVKGAWLTQTNGAKTNSASIVVDDDLYFHGDERIKFSNGASSYITAINRTTNTLTIDPAVSVPDNAGLALYANTPGALPNIGPWGSGGENQAPAKPSGLSVR